MSQKTQKQKIDNQYFEAYTDLSPDECVQILKKKLKRIWDLEEYMGRVKGYSFWIEHIYLKNFFVRYGPPRFSGEIIKFESGSMIKGSFNKQLKLFVVEIIFSILFLTYVVIEQFLEIIKFIAIKDLKSIVIIAFAIILIIVIMTALDKLWTKTRQVDRKLIKEFIINNLYATPTQAD